MPSAGETIGGKYRLERELGRGGMGVVFEATNIATDARVAVKFLGEAAARHEEIAARFMREAKAAGRLRSRYVARVFDADRTASGEPFIVMELLRGMDLAELLDRGPLPIAHACSILVQACAGVDEAHREGIVHRDLKPANLFLATEGNEVVKVLDFGVSKLSSAEGGQHTGSQAVLGTLAFMSPEHLTDARSVDARTDVWALGVILFFALEGHLPFPGDGPSLIAQVVMPQTSAMTVTRADVPPALVEVVARCLVKNRDARISSVAELAEMLVPFASPAAVSDALGEIRARRHALTPREGVPALDVMGDTLMGLGGAVSPTVSSSAMPAAQPMSGPMSHPRSGPMFAGTGAPTSQTHPSFAQPTPPKTNAMMLVVLGALAATTLLLGVMLLVRRGPAPPPITEPVVVSAPVSAAPPPPPPAVSIILLPAPPTASASASSTATVQGAVKSKPAVPPAHRSHDAGASSIPTLL
jgi:eukaryotic-like serine/threonine-protein kinase